MSTSRLASFHSLAYLLPLVLWLSVQLELNGWTNSQVHLLFQQSVLITIYAQCLGLSLLFSRADEQPLTNEIYGLLLILLFPLPLFTLSWLTGSLELTALFKLAGVVTLTGLLAITILRTMMAFLPIPHLQESVVGVLQLSLLMLLWNYRQLWLHWSGV